MLLATEIMRQLKRHRELQEGCTPWSEAARAALDSAVDACGFDDLTVQPKASIEGHSRAHRVRVVPRDHAPVGVARRRRAPPPTPLPCRRFPEARACAGAYHRLLAGHVAAAACEGNLRRLAREYARTERRARALENVVLPEIDVALRYIEEQLDAVDQEEAVRVRNAARART